MFVITFRCVMMSSCFVSFFFFVSLNMRIFEKHYFSASSYVIVIVNSFMFVRPILFKFSRYKSWVFRSCKPVLIPGVIPHISCKWFALCILL